MSKASSPAPAPTAPFSSLTTLVAASSEVDFYIRGIVLIQPHNSSFFSAYTTIGSPTTYFSAANLSPNLKLLLAHAPTFPKTDRHGNQRIIKAGIYLDDLPADITRPKLTRIAAEANVAAPVVATSATVAATRKRKSRKKPAAVTRKQMTKIEKRVREPAPAPLHETKPAVMDDGVAGRPKGLEIDMVPGAFMPAGGAEQPPQKAAGEIRRRGGGGG